MMIIVGSNVTYGVSRSQLHTPIPSGTFALQLSSRSGSIFSTDVNFNAGQDDLRNAIQSLSPRFNVSSN
ncbi:hypothetical protein EON64_00765 [archaeon]|nr:MAG: hypothetical protein EON64_00765 [archaeon]